MYIINFEHCGTVAYYTSALTSSLISFIFKGKIIKWVTFPPFFWGGGLEEFDFLKFFFLISWADRKLAHFWLLFLFLDEDHLVFFILTHFFSSFYSHFFHVYYFLPHLLFSLFDFFLILTLTY